MKNIIKMLQRSIKYYHHSYIIKQQVCLDEKDLCLSSIIKRKAIQHLILSFDQVTSANKIPLKDFDIYL